MNEFLTKYLLRIGLLRFRNRDFQIGNFLDLFAKGCAFKNYIHKVFLLYMILQCNKGTFCTGTGTFVPCQRACKSAREAASEADGTFVVHGANSGIM